jgi:AcrR family transcriptional regulator
MPVNIQILLNKKLFIRDPQETELGKNIITHSILLIDKLGFEQFTFKKLADEIHSTEASVYRYFENKHKLLVYLVSWYWAWIEFQIDFKTNNITDPEKALRIILGIIAESGQEDLSIEHINESILHRIVVCESSKAYLTKQVDKENSEGFFMNYKSLCQRIAEFIRQINPKYPYPKALASNLIETAHEQLFFAQHLPGLTDVKVTNQDYSSLTAYLEHIAFDLLNSRI